MTLEEFRERCRQQQPLVHADDCDMDEDCCCSGAEDPAPAGELAVPQSTQAKPR